MEQHTPSKDMTVLLLGSGGREHALAWRLRRSPSVARLVAAPGNPGIGTLAELRAVDPEDGEGVVALAREIGADLVVIGPEAPLAAGVSDRLREAGFAVFGPSQAAARLEWDKAFANDFMGRHGIPTAASRTFSDAEIEEARAFVAGGPLPVVIKANGLAAGKGVVIAGTAAEAVETVDSMLSGRAFGDASRTIVVEEFLVGEEASIIALVDGTDYRLLVPSQDHKRVGDDDTGPNTGGMGAYAPAPLVTAEVLERVEREIVVPLLRGMAEEGTPCSGCLYTGLMIHEGTPKVVEFNCRFGDPETQVVLPLLEGDFGDYLMAAATGRLGSTPPIVSSGSAVCVVIAAGGYPGSYRKGMEIAGLDEVARREGIVVFHAGTRSDGDRVVTSGGRVLGLTAISSGDDLEATIRQAYEAVGDISFEGAFYRHDIGRKALRRRAVEAGE